MGVGAHAIAIIIKESNVAQMLVSRLDLQTSPFLPAVDDPLSKELELLFPLPSLPTSAYRVLTLALERLRS